MNKSIVYAAWLCLPTAALAMPVSEFVPKANALEKKGMMAVFSSDFGVLKREVETATQTAAREESARTKGGGKPTMCLPKNGKLSLGTTEVLGHMRAVPAARRGMSVKDAMAELLRRKYPCAV